MKRSRVLWVDDEIDLLKPHIHFLEAKDYQVVKATNGSDALELIHNEDFDMVFLDENMTGLSGLETLSEIKNQKPYLPVVMITKSEEENIMEEAIGAKINDYLIKPVNPNQILLCLKKNLDKKSLVNQKTNKDYLQEFRKIANDLFYINTIEEWITLYEKLVYWELELENVNDNNLKEILESQKQEANQQFFRFIKDNYEDFIHDKDLCFSHNLLKEKVFPTINETDKTLLIVIDNLRLDQWRILEPLLNDLYKKKREISYLSLLPTATQYARNALFAGLTPLEISKKYPQYWKFDHESGGKNLFEDKLLAAQIKNLGYTFNNKYFKISNLKAGKELVDQFNTYKNNPLTTIVFNFVDILSHAKTETEIIKELALNDKAYRSITASWFKNSPLFELIQKAQQSKMKLIITTDHGTINCKNPTKVIGDKELSLNLRYKTGKTLSFEDKDVYAVKKPENICLPKSHINSSFVFAKEDLFFAYPNNYNHFVKYYKNTYQHGGISMEEMIIPCAFLEPK